MQNRFTISVCKLRTNDTITGKMHCLTFHGFYYKIWISFNDPRCYFKRFTYSSFEFSVYVLMHWRNPTAVAERLWFAPLSLTLLSTFKSQIRDLNQLGRERQRKRLLNFQLSIFPFLVCITLAFIFCFAWRCVNMKVRSFVFKAAWRLKWFVLYKTRELRFSRSVFLKTTAERWLHSHVKWLYSVQLSLFFITFSLTFPSSLLKLSNNMSLVWQRWQQY